MQYVTIKQKYLDVRLLEIILKIPLALKIIIYAVSFLFLMKNIKIYSLTYDEILNILK